MEEEKLKIQIYRHKIYKDIFLERNNNICGGGVNTDWFKATKNMIDAIRSFEGKNPTSVFKEHFFENGKSLLNAKINVTKEVEDYDGFKGKLTKELILSLNDFELITLIEE